MIDPFTFLWLLIRCKKKCSKFQALICVEMLLEGGILCGVNQGKEQQRPFRIRKDSGYDRCVL